MFEMAVPGTIESCPLPNIPVVVDDHIRGVLVCLRRLDVSWWDS